MGSESNTEMGEGRTVKTLAFLPSNSNFPVLPRLLTFNNNVKTLDSFSFPILLLKADFGGGQWCQLCSSSVRYVRISTCTGIRRMPAGQQGWARCGAGTVGRLGTVGLLIREV